MSVLFYLALFLFLFLCGITCLVVLVQESKSMGLGASFGGDAGESIFGTSTAAVMKKITAWLGIIFMAACIMLSLWTQALGRNTSKNIPTAIEQIQE